MYKRILVPVDGSDTSNKALVHALELARLGGGSVRLVHVFADLVVTMPGYDLTGAFLDQMRAFADKTLGDSLAIAKAAGVPAEGKVLEAFGGRLGDLVEQEARSFGADLVVVGTHGRRGIGRVLLGSGAEQVIRLATVPVLVIRSPEASPAAA